MNLGWFRFFGDLDIFLAPEHKGELFAYHFTGRQSVKHLIEALGVPHTEVGRILVQDVVVENFYLVQNGDRVQVYPVEDGYPLSDDVEEQGGDLRFLLDNHLGKLATYLRILGFDAQYRNDYQDNELAQIACQDGRILLTRDRGLLKRKVILLGYFIRSKDPNKQIVEVIRRFGLLGKIQPFRRCLRCNNPLTPVSKDMVLDRLEPLTKKYYDEFHLCPVCDQIYWKGSHYEHMEKLLTQLFKGS